MSFYEGIGSSRHKDRQNQSDTFLSRVFGLHSIYNNLPENYNYYGHDIEQLEESRPAESGPVPLLDSENAEQPPLAEPLLQLELDLDLSLDSEDESQQLPFLAPRLLVNASKTDQHAHVKWGTDVNRYGKDSEEALGSKGRFTLSRRLFSRGPQEELLPMYNINDAALQHRREPRAEPTPSFHTQYQKKNFNRVLIPPRERALYLWANIVNMDEFLIDLYYYYRGKGFGNIIAGRCVDIFILVFILSFTTFLKWGIDYDLFFNRWSSHLEVSITLLDLVIKGFFWSRVPFSVKVLLFGFFCYIVLRIVQLYFDYRYKLQELRNFYAQLLNIHSEQELLTILWSSIVESLMLLKDYNSLTSTTPNLPPHYVNDLSSKVRLNAHDIANRIMRKENYMIALINKDVLDLAIPMPSFLGNIFSSKAVLTRTLEWNLKLCINNFIFNDSGQIKQAILKEGSRNSLSQELSARFKMAALINLFLCPFIVIYFVLLYFFRYFNEYKSNPSSLVGLRQYTPWAEWKLREFNELPHFFMKRLQLSIGPASTYINQFPSSFLVVNGMTLVNFVSGAITAVLVIMGLLFDDEEHNFWSFELSQNRTTLFYISIFGTLWAITANSLNTSTVANSAESMNQGATFFYDPEASLRYVSQFTHYLPSSWNGRLHSVEVKTEFCELYSLKIIIILNEILSLILTPFVLWFKVSSNSSAIIDFFRDYSIHVDGLGYVCYFAMFNFEEKDKNMMHNMNKKKQRRHESRVKKESRDKAKHSDLEVSSDDMSDPDLNSYYQDDKMIKSYMYFLESYGNGDPKKTRQPQRAQQLNSSRYPRAAPSPKEGPSSSLHMSKGQWNGLALDSVYESNYALGEASTHSEPQSRKGVLGMINQFSKQQAGR
ncbi:hypothetical protein C7M61_003995 [Candidozyma pseudohaemuli]|uniref:Autophagy-related protein 9 n=1 Tax=Candidozyma pseudohaemuli TaxID=418784 RepID=A0A2P7YKN1_9ASCO|nr:hypothetical protein C7M61_003995 [[Candida] pseudohaemulonii]PSK36522.1 hypothetical protein C7M61_003995 [[Candida] pseudohaemulonii]